MMSVTSHALYTNNYKTKTDVFNTFQLFFNTYARSYQVFSGSFAIIKHKMLIFITKPPYTTHYQWSSLIPWRKLQ